MHIPTVVSVRVKANLVGAAVSFIDVRESRQPSIGVAQARTMRAAIARSVSANTQKTAE